jgi:hypothetical protein
MHVCPVHQRPALRPLNSIVRPRLRDPRRPKSITVDLMEEFVWMPGEGIDPASLSRIRLYFRRPNEPMGEAWFMSEERRFFHELRGNLDGLTAWHLQEPLQEIASGTSSFGPKRRVA